MKIGHYNCMALQEDSVSLAVDSDEMVVTINSEYDTLGHKVKSKATSVILTKEDALELACDILRHYNEAYPALNRRG